MASILALSISACSIISFLSTDLSTEWLSFLILALLFAALAYWANQGPDILINQEGLGDPNKKQLLHWHNIAGMKLVHGYRNRWDLTIWLHEPGQHQIYLQKWVGDRAQGTKDSPIKFGLDYTNGVYIWRKVTALQQELGIGLELHGDQYIMKAID
ncbi:MAG: hypothetical protein AAF614_10835 [Chloroflexota bacterium]